MGRTDEGIGYVSGSDTSKEAADLVGSGKRSRAQTLRAEVLHYIRGQEDGATCDEVEQGLDLTHQTASPRVVELRERGLIVDSGLRRLTRSNRKAVVYKPVPTVAPGEQASLF